MPHILWDDLELYLMGRSRASDEATISEHLRTCSPCRSTLAKTAEYVALLRKGLIEVEGIAELHHTNAGIVALQVQETPDGRWTARLSGADIDAGQTAPNRNAALETGREMFRRLFPEHACTTACRGS